jgi:N-acetylneuraminic acid mutarotase
VPNISGEIPRGVAYHAAVSASNNELIVIGGKTEGKKYTPGVLILKPKNERRKSFCILSPSFE